MSRRLKRSIALKSSTPNALLLNEARLFAQAMRWQQQGELETAKAQYQTILGVNPRHAGSLHYLGTIHYQQGDLVAAAEWMARSIEADGGRASFYSNLGLVLQAQGKLAEAEAVYRRALELQPQYPEALNNLGTVLQARGRVEGALPLYRRAVALRPDYVDAHENAGNALIEQSRRSGAWSEERAKRAEAILRFREVVRLDPHRRNAYYNLAHALQVEEEFAEAIALYRLAVEDDPLNPENYVNWGNALESLGKVEEAIRLYERGCALFDQGATEPPKREQIIGHMNLGMVQLLTGGFAEGFAQYEWRLKDRSSPAYREFSQPQWRGEPLDGRRILLWAEQGLGDSLQFLRYVPMVCEAGGEVVLEVQPCLRRLVPERPGMRVISPRDALPEFDTHCPLMSLPQAFGTTVTTIPVPVPYLVAPEEERRAAAELAWPANGLKVGLVWAGNAAHVNDRLRSLSFAQVKPLLGVEGVRFYSLQVERGDGIDARLGDLRLVAPNMADTAAKVMRLDLVIAADTAVAHLAGALGVRTWVMLPFAPDWRWQLERTDSPWYSGMRLFRQPERGDWEAVVEEVRRELGALAGSLF